MIWQDIVLFLMGAILLLISIPWFYPKKRYSLTEMKSLIKDTHVCLKQAAENQRKLYKIFNDVERNMEELR